jgi:hypothetical protein
MNMNPGVYKDTTGHYGYLNPCGNFVANISRDKARELAVSSGFSTTLKGIYIPKVEKPVKKEKRAYRKLNLDQPRMYGDVIMEVEPENHYRTYMACLMYTKKHPEFTWAYVRHETGSTFVSL